jgi:hypothetical protein
LDSFGKRSGLLRFTLSSQLLIKGKACAIRGMPIRERKKGKIITMLVFQKELKRKKEKAGKVAFLQRRDRMTCISAT